MRLGDISKIESGLILSRKRARNELELKKTYKVLSLNNIEAHGDFNENELEVFQSNEILQKHYFTQEGLILIRLNEPFTAVCIQKHQTGILIPSYFMSVEIQHKDYLPEFISWYLNTELVKREFHKEQSGTSTPNINQSIVKKLKIPKLPLSKQKDITHIHKLYLKERRLLLELIDQKELYYKGITHKIIYQIMEDYL